MSAVARLLVCCHARCLQVVLYEAEIINEWLEEAFPNPPMLPQQPLLRAKVCQLWCTVQLCSSVKVVCCQFAATLGTGAEWQQ